MSTNPNPYGVAPPPPPTIFEPPAVRQTALVRTTKRKRRVPLPPEPHRWRRRAALMLAFLAGAALLGANLATWAERTVMDSNVAASATAPAAFPETAAELVPSLVEQTLLFVNRTAVATLGATDPLELETALGDDPEGQVANAVNVAVYSDQFKQEWEAAVLSAWESQRNGVRTGTSDTQQGPGVTVVVPLDRLGQEVTAQLTQEGYAFLSGREIALEYAAVTLVGPTLDNRPALAFADSYWWLLILVTIALIVAAVLVARDRLRMGFVLAVDAVFVLAVCLILVPLVRQVADDSAQTPGQERLLVDVYDALTDPLVTQTVVLMVVATVTAVVLAVLGRRERTRGRSERAPAAA